MKNLKYRLFEYGVYGTEIRHFKNEELKILLFDLEVEIIEQDTFLQYKKQFVITSFINQKNEILEKHGITKTNMIDKDLLDCLSIYYIKMNIYAWISRIEILEKYQNMQYILILNAFVTDRNFLLYKNIDVPKKIKKKEIMSVIDQFVKDGYMETETINNKNLHRFTRTNDIINIYIEENINSRFYTLRKINELVESHTDGITTPEIVIHLRSDLKFILRNMHRLLLINNDILKFLEVEGKIKRYRYFTKASYSSFRDKNEHATVNNSILRMDKLQTIKDLIKEHLPLVINTTWCIKLAEKLNTKYIPDTKNFKKLCIEAGYQIKAIPQTYGGYSFVNVVYEEGTEIDANLFKNIRKPTDTKNTKPNNILLYNNFVSYKPFIAMDHGYQNHKTNRIIKLESIIREALQIKTILHINREFVENLRLTDFLSLHYYPMYIFDKNTGREALLFETVEQEKYSYHSIDYNTKLSSLKTYENFEYTRLFQLVNSHVIFELVKEINSDYFNVVIDIDLISVSSILSHQYDHKVEGDSDDAYLLNLLNEFDIFAPYIEKNKRIKLYTNVLTLGIAKDLSQLHNYIDMNYTVIEYDALMKCFLNYSQAINKHDAKEFASEPSTKLKKACNAVKRKIIENECIKLDFFETNDKYTVVRILNILKSNNIIMIDDANKTIAYNEVYKKQFTKHDYVTLFPRKYYLNGIEEFSDATYMGKMLNYILNLLIMKGSFSLEHIIQKIRILTMEELNEVISLYSQYIQVEEIENTKYLTLKVA